MPNVVSSKTISAQDLQLLKLTIDTFDDGSTQIRVGGGSAPVGAAPTPGLSNVAASAGNTTLHAANSARTGMIIQNDADKALYLKYGATASVTSYTYKIPAGRVWEMPLPVYQGIIDGIWEASPTGAARVTELT